MIKKHVPSIGNPARRDGTIIWGTDYLWHEEVGDVAKKSPRQIQINHRNWGFLGRKERVWLLYNNESLNQNHVGAFYMVQCVSSESTKCLTTEKFSYQGLRRCDPDT
ncbi:hypothetical protein MGG_15799 [Pyricularia oryzae 70-15]|uniref:Uncharacterized protein n=2 Tax=Pyricularia oryzae TaxID=318829 RepID=G4MX36_PYRO7|nr:uncharacterized protein MGG_15799 [Pyricularia oryzae 70-15]EHA55134.1 hypothetical protein MGG_15799 [Pyricularia oryzae 70-15]